jgi:hypothetical protein
MNPEEIKSIVETAVAGEFRYIWVYIVASVLIGILSAFLFEYFKTKGHNLATKSDIDTLTKKVEEIKFEYIKKIELLKGTHDIKNPKRKELYEKVEKMRSFLIKSKNDPTFKTLDPIFTETKDILLFLSSNDALKDMESEMIIIQDDYNNWVTAGKLSNGRNVNLKFDATSKALESIQRKLIE